MLQKVELRASKLRDVLSDSGCQLTHTDCIEVISSIEQRPDAAPYTGHRTQKQQIAELYVDELLEAVSELSYPKFTKHFEEKYLVLFTEREFKQDIPDTFNEFGSYIRRDFMGTVGGTHRPGDDRYPNEVRYLWRCFFEKNEALLMVSIYQKEGTHYISAARSL